MASFDIDMSELSDLGRHLADAVPDRAARAAHVVTVAEATAVQARAKAGAPRDRPWLATAGIRRASGRDAGGSWSHVYAALEDPEGRPSPQFVEHGTSKMPPQPFMRPAIGPTEGTYPAAVLAAIDPFGASPAGSAGADDG